MNTHPQLIMAIILTSWSLVLPIQGWGSLHSLPPCPPSAIGVIQRQIPIPPSLILALFDGLESTCQAEVEASIVRSPLWEELSKGDTIQVALNESGHIARIRFPHGGGVGVVPERETIRNRSKGEWMTLYEIMEFYRRSNTTRERMRGVIVD